MRGAARADEVRVVRVREPVRVGADRRQHRALLEHEHDVGRAGGDEQRRRSLGALRIGNCVAPTVEDAEHRPRRAATLGEEPAPSRLARADLEVRVARAAERAGAEQCAAQVRARGSSAREDAAAAAARAARCEASSTPARCSVS